MQTRPLISLVSHHHDMALAQSTVRCPLRSDPHLPEDKEEEDRARVDLSCGVRFMAAVGL